jgi:hypothetical protein
MPTADRFPAAPPRHIAAVLPEVLARYGLALPPHPDDQRARTLPPAAVPVLPASVLLPAGADR